MARSAEWSRPRPHPPQALALTRCDEAPACTPEQTRQRVAAVRDLREAEHRLRCAEQERPPSARLLAAARGLAEANGRRCTDRLPAGAVRAQLARCAERGGPGATVLHLSDLDVDGAPCAAGRGPCCTADLQRLSGVLLLFPCLLALDSVAATPATALAALASVERLVWPTFATAAHGRVQEPVAVPGAPEGVWEFTIGMPAWLWARVALCAAHWVVMGGASPAAFAAGLGVPVGPTRAIVAALTG